MLITSCGADTRFAATINGVEIPAGVYIYKEMIAYYEAMNLQSEEDIAAAIPLLDSTIEGVPARQWISDETIKSVREYAAINEKFAALGLSYDLDSYGVPMDQTISDSVERSWDEGDADMLIPLGISKESYKQLQLNSQKTMQLFQYYYGDGGEKAVPEAEIKKYLTDNFARINYIEMELKDGEGNLLKSEGKEERRKMAEEYITRAKTGDDFADLLGEYTDWYDELRGVGGDVVNMDATTGEIVNPEDEVPPTNETVIGLEYTTPSAEVVKKVFELQAENPDFTDPQYFIVEAENGEKIWVVELRDLFSDQLYYDANKAMAVSALKTEEFEDLIDIWTRDQNVSVNEKAVERYKPDMFIEQ